MTKCSECGGRFRHGKCRGRCYREAATLAENQALANSEAYVRIGDGLTDRFNEENEMRAGVGLKALPVAKLDIQHRRLERALRGLWRTSRKADREVVSSKGDSHVQGDSAGPERTGNQNTNARE